MDERTRRAAIVTAVAGALAYSASKVELALRDELGMPGFPAPADSYRGVEDVTAAQLGNAGVGAIAALAIAVLWRPIRHRRLRRAVLAGSWLGIAMIGTGVLGFTARAVGAVPSLGPTPPHWFPAIIALVVGAVWMVSWGVAAGAMPVPGGGPARARR